MSKDHILPDDQTNLFVARDSQATKVSDSSDAASSPFADLAKGLAESAALGKSLTGLTAAIPSFASDLSRATASPLAEITKGLAESAALGKSLTDLTAATPSFASDLSRATASPLAEITKGLAESAALGKSLTGLTTATPSFASDLSRATASPFAEITKGLAESAVLGKSLTTAIPSFASDLSRATASPFAEITKGLAESAVLGKSLTTAIPSFASDLSRATASPFAEITKGLAERQFASATLASLTVATPLAGTVLGQVAALNIRPHRTDWGLVSRSASAFTDHFRVPEIGEISKLLSGINSPIEDRYGLTRATLQSSLLAMEHPWLDTQDTLASITGIAKLQGIGHLVTNAPTFDIGVAALLRSDFGDWRDPVSWPSNLATDISARAGLYIERGFNPALTEFPEEAFEEGLEAAGIEEGIPALIAAYGEPLSRSDDEEEMSFARNNRVHDWLQRFETQIRRFIDTVMATAHGADWPRHKLPNGLYEKWVEKQAKTPQAILGRLFTTLTSQTMKS
ncbi:MAG: hypothetical protein E5V90_17940 [Mesorhizobium sp.]|nr:MAG: hypothetical protein E5V90_17940 [Mesorhizobium sp.]